MTWLQYLSFLAAITGVRWALNELTPHGDDYLFGGIIIGCLAWIIYQRFRAHALLDLWFRSSDADREALGPALMDAVGLRPRLPVPVNPEDRLTFQYPSASRGYLTLQFWLCVIFGAGMLRPILSAENVEPSNGWVLFILGCVFTLAAYWTSRQLRFVGDSVIVDAYGIEVQRGKRVRERIEWSELTQVGRTRGGRPLIFGAEDGRKITVWAELIDHVQFEDVVARRLIGEVRSSGNGHH